MEIIFKSRQTDVPARFREYASAKLNRLEKLDQKAIRVDVEISVERNPRQASQKERVELTIRSPGPAIRAEAAAEDRLAALDLALAKLNSRLRRALDRKKSHHAAGTNAVTGASASRSDSSAAVAGSSEDEEPRWNDRSAVAQAEPQGEALARAESVVAIQMEGDGPLVVRQKFHHAKPITIDQALLEMELVGHDFYLFHDVDEDMPSVVYRRHGYQYGVIRLVEAVAGRAAPPEPSVAGLGAKIPGRRRAEHDDRGVPDPRLDQDGARRRKGVAALRQG